MCGRYATMPYVHMRADARAGGHRRLNQVINQPRRFGEIAPQGSRHIAHMRSTRPRGSRANDAPGNGAIAHERARPAVLRCTAVYPCRSCDWDLREVRSYLEELNIMRKAVI